MQHYTSHFILGIDDAVTYFVIFNEINIKNWSAEVNKLQFAYLLLNLLMLILN